MQTQQLNKVIKDKSIPTPMDHRYRKWLFMLPYDDPFVMSVSGEAFAGKSSFLLRFMSRLCGKNSRNKQGDRCLYLNIEEPLRRGKTIQQKCRTMKLSPVSLQYIDIIDDVGSDFYADLTKILDQGNYKYVVIDSVSMLAGVSTNKHIEMWDYIQSRPESFIVVLHYTKSKKGKMQGPTMWEHNPDVVVWLANDGTRSVASFKKNRYLGDKPRLAFDTYKEEVVSVF